MGGRGGGKRELQEERERKRKREREKMTRVAHKQRKKLLQCAEKVQ